jgi:hypothetical protein
MRLNLKIFAHFVVYVIYFIYICYHNGDLLNKT